MTVYGQISGFLALFYSAIGIICIWLAYKAPKQLSDMRNRRSELEPIRPRWWLVLVGGFFLILSLLAIPGLTVDALENGDLSPCEWLINTTNETYRYGWNYTDGSEHWVYSGAPDGPQTETADFMRLFHLNTDYTYYNSCASVTVPGYISSWFTIQAWTIWIAFFALLLGLLIYSLRFWGRMI